MIIKAKPSYLELSPENNFQSLGSASTHELLKAGKDVEWKGKIPKKLMETLTDVKKTKKGEK